MSDKNGELLPQALLRTVRVSFKTYGSGKPLSSRKREIRFSMLEIVFLIFVIRT